MHRRRLKTRLIIKTDSDAVSCDVIADGAVSIFRGAYTDEQIASLYALSDVYVSAHRSEGWGLPLSDAMTHGLVCVGTAHSGNRDFMTAANSLLVECDIAPVYGEACDGLRDSSMSWAYAHTESIEAQMIRAYDEVRGAKSCARALLAARDIRRFDARHIRCLVRARMRAIARHLAAQAK